MDFEQLKLEILTQMYDFGVDFTSIDPKYAEGINDTLTALKHIMENDMYVNWWDILDTLKSHISMEELAEMFEQEYLN